MAKDKKAVKSVEAVKADKKVKEVKAVVAEAVNPSEILYKGDDTVIRVLPVGSKGCIVCIDEAAVYVPGATLVSSGVGRRLA